MKRLLAWLRGTSVGDTPSRGGRLCCPDCGAAEFFEGPYTNVFCAECKQGFDNTPFGLRRIPRKWEGIEESAP